MGGEVALLRLAADQHGVISRSRAVRAGLSADQIERRVRSGRWERVLPGVYRIEGAPQTWQARLSAVALWAGPGAVFSHRTAAALWGFARFKAGGVVHVTLRRRAQDPEGVSAHRAASLEAVTQNGLRVTSVLRTLLDLSATELESDVRASVDEALRRKWTTTEKLQSFVARNGKHRGIALLSKLLKEYLGGHGPTESELEARVQELLEAEGFPRASRQQTHHIAGRRRRLDFTFPGTRVVIEADGYAWHSSPIAFERDRARVSALTARGFRVLQWTWAALHERPDELLRDLRLALASERRAA